LSVLRFQMLTCRIEIATDDPAVVTALNYLIQDAVQEIEPHTLIRYDVTGLSGAFHIAENGVEIGTAETPHGVMELIYHHAHEAAYRTLPPHARIHAGCVTIAGKRVLLVGRKEAGKTTLSLRLLHDGIAVHGDELVLVTADGRTWPYPRRFHVRPTTFPLIPELAGREERFAFALPPEGGKIYGLAPTELGQEWRIAPAPVDAILYLKKDPLAESSVKEISPEAAFKRLRRHTAFPERSVKWLTTLYGLVKGARNLVLINGNLRGTAEVVTHLWGH
jgi:hypothetical protein